jgi:hypothetical protein
MIMDPAQAHFCGIFPRATLEKKLKVKFRGRSLNLYVEKNNAYVPHKHHTCVISRYNFDMDFMVQVPRFKDCLYICTFLLLLF